MKENEPGNRMLSYILAVVAIGIIGTLVIGFWQFTHDPEAIKVATESFNRMAETSNRQGSIWAGRCSEVTLSDGRKIRGRYHGDTANPYITDFQGHNINVINYTIEDIDCE